MGQTLLTIYTSDPSIPNSDATSYILTDHNRQPVQISYETLEQSSRMADGTMRRFITANKKNISVTWQDVPSAGGINFTADGNQGGAFLKSFYEENVYHPVWIKMTYSEESWRFQNLTTITNNYSATNPTFNTTIDTYKMNNVPHLFNVASVAYSAFSSSSATASITTTIDHNLSMGSTPEIITSGMGELFNGAWRLDSIPNSKTLVFKFRNLGNDYGKITVNSYYQQGNNAIFNVDSTANIKAGTTFQVKNGRVVYGSDIGTYSWTVLSSPAISTTQFTASTTASATNGGFYGELRISTASAGSQIFAGPPYATVQAAVGSDIIKVFMKDFNYTINKRYAMTDIVNMNITFTEI